MTTDRDFDRIAMAWLADGPDQLADRVMDAVVDEIHVTPQRHALRLPWRFPSMTTPARVAAAAVIGVLAIGGAIFVLQPGRASIGGPAASPAASPTPSPSPMALVEGTLAAGTYTTTPFVGADALGVCLSQPGCKEDPADDTIRITFTVPDGWTGGPRHTVWVAAPSGTPTPAWVTFERGASLYAQPCGNTPPPTIAVGPTVDDFVNAVVANPKLSVTTPVDVSLGGFSGKYFRLQVPADIAACRDAYWPWEPGFYAQGPSQRWYLWVLDVNGIRVVVHGMDFATTSSAQQRELDEIVQSIRIQP